MGAGISYGRGSMDWLLENWTVFIIVVVAVTAAVAGLAVMAVNGPSKRPAFRPRPRCGEDVPKGQLDCNACGFDLRTIGAS